MEKNIRNLKIYFTVGALLVGGFFAGKQIKLCRDAHKLDSKISTALSDIVSENNNIINVAAHRGFSSKEVENSLQAITAAASESYISTIELDVRMTKDGYFVISHDDIVYALCGPNYYGGFEIKEISIFNSNYSELINTPLIYCNPFTSLVGSNKIDYELIHYRILMLRNRAFKLTGLAEAIKACGDKKIILDLKIEGDNYYQYVKRLLETLGYICETEEDITLASFNVDAARYLRNNSDFKVAIIVNKEKNLKYCDEFGAVAIKCTLFLDGVINLDDLLAKGKVVIIWTVNTSGTLRKLFITIDSKNCMSDDVTYVTNFPDLIVATAHKYDYLKDKDIKNKDVTSLNDNKDLNKEKYYLGTGTNSIHHRSDKTYWANDIRKLEADKCKEVYYKKVLKRKIPGRYPGRAK